MQKTFSSIRDMLNKRVFFCCPLGFLAMEIHPLGTMTNLGKKNQDRWGYGSGPQVVGFHGFFADLRGEENGVTNFRYNIG